MKKHLTLILVVMMLVSLVPAVTAQDAPVELTIWADNTRAPVLEELGASFEEEYGVDLVIQEVDFGGIRDQLKIAGPAGEGPDIIIGAHDWLGELVSNGLLAPVDLGDKAEEFSPGAITAFTYDGQLYGVPYAVENVALFYNMDLVPEPPTTWDEVRTMSQDIIESGAAQYGFVRQDGDSYHFYPIMTAFGGYIFGLDDLGNYDPEDVGVDNPGSVAALQWVQGMIKDGIMPSGLDGNTAQTLFFDGQAAMYITGPWNLQASIDAGLNFGIAAFPAGPEGIPGAPFSGVQAFMINAFSENALLAQAFLTEFVASEELQFALYEAGQRAPALLSAKAMVEDPYQAGFAAAGEFAQPMPAIPAMSAVWSPLEQAIILGMQGPDEDAAELLTLAGDAIRAAIAGE